MIAYVTSFVAVCCIRCYCSCFERHICPVDLLHLLQLLQLELLPPFLLALLISLLLMLLAAAVTAAADTSLLD